MRENPFPLGDGSSMNTLERIFGVVTTSPAPTISWYPVNPWNSINPQYLITTTSPTYYWTTTTGDTMVNVEDSAKI